MTDLVPHWLHSVQEASAQGDLPAAGADLLGRWAEPHRRYHGLDHLAAVLARVDELADETSDATAVRLAAWFHDAVYDPTAPDNEERSALLASETLQALHVDKRRVDEVARLVRLTRTHDPLPRDTNGAVLCDADLAVLAATAQDYARYVAEIRAEYAHLDDATFRSGRSAVLRSLLDRPTLFTTAHGRTAWEVAARTNIRRELAHYA